MHFSYTIELSILFAPRMSGLEALAAIERSIVEIVCRGQFIIVRDCQRWLDGEQSIEEPMLTIIRQAALLPETARRPIFLTSTRIPRVHRLMWQLVCLG